MLLRNGRAKSLKNHDREPSRQQQKIPLQGSEYKIWQIIHDNGDDDHDDEDVDDDDKKTLR